MLFLFIRVVTSQHDGISLSPLEREELESAIASIVPRSITVNQLLLGQLEELTMPLLMVCLKGLDRCEGPTSSAETLGLYGIDSSMISPIDATGRQVHITLINV